ncbi:PTS sugar transporter subunit IIA [Thermophilibacter provencensis]|uniref:PTS fructose transporter subunit IIA n=1 Tax=Thermophilibacter provencensis TaxID=1852386 RepID=A0ABT7V3M8_9ACTN|nr:PTS fructose transporter subunit IIA [Thermophilibacter provencensis]MDM8271076.1 PTS fructose transporter subunit IIA [Thermophilibacter provencensis]HJA28106.1 PTS fructose transporter subunit IIA [Candidatus Olsenella pullicola]
MRYLLLVSHGTFAPGLHSVLDMLVGKRDDILSCSLRDGEGADQFVAELEEVIAPITLNDRVIVLGDLIGGSPLTNALNTLAAHGLLAQARAFGGMNLPMALTAAFDLQSDDEDALCASMLSEGQAAMSEMALDLGSDEEDEDL